VNVAKENYDNISPLFPGLFKRPSLLKWNLSLHRSRDSCPFWSLSYYNKETKILCISPYIPIH